MEGTQLPATIVPSVTPVNVKTTVAPSAGTQAVGVPATVSVSSTSVNTCAAPLTATTTTTTTAATASAASSNTTILSKTPIHNLPIELLQKDSGKRRR